jgi:hypothetical protein
LTSQSSVVVRHPWCGGRRGVADAQQAIRQG